MNQLDDSNVPNSQDVFELLNSGVIGLGKTTGIFNVKSIENFDENDEAGTTWRAACKASYQKAVFFFSLMSEMKYQAKGTGFIWTAKKTDICYVYNPLVGMYSICNYKPKFKSHQYPIVPHLNWPSRKVNTNKLVFRPYSGSRKLEIYDMDVYFAFPKRTIGGTNQVHVRTNS